MDLTTTSVEFSFGVSDGRAGPLTIRVSLRSYCSISSILSCSCMTLLSKEFIWFNNLVMVSSLLLRITCTACKTMDTIVLPSGERVLRSSLETMAMMSDEGLGLVKPGLGASGVADAGDGVVSWASGRPLDLKLIVVIVELRMVYYGSNWIQCRSMMQGRNGDGADFVVVWVGGNCWNRGACLTGMPQLHFYVELLVKFPCHGAQGEYHTWRS